MRSHTVITRKIRAGRRPLYLELRPNAGAAAMLFYPGTLLSPYQYRPLLAALRETGLAAAALHLTGHGRNRHHVGFRFATLLEDGLYAENWLRREGYGPVAVCGHSQGGILTLAHAAASGTAAAAFPITGVLPQTPEAFGLTRFAGPAARREAIAGSVAALARILPRLPMPVQFYLSMRRISAGARRTVISRRRMRLAYPLAFLDSLFRTEVPPRLHCPLCFFSARDDALFTPEITQATFARLEAPSKRLVWLPGGGHLAAMNPPLCRFIARTTAAVCAGSGLPLRLEYGDAHHGR